MAETPNAPRLVSSDQIFDGSHPMHTIYEFTPDQKHDPAQADNPIPRVMVTLDGFPVNPGMVTVWTRFEGAERTRQLPPHIAGAIAGPLMNALDIHMMSHGEELGAERDMKLGRDHDETSPALQRITRVTSESSVRGPHTLLVPAFERTDLPRLWERTYTEDDPTRATDDELARMQALLEVKGELKEQMDLLLSTVYWRAVNKPTMTWWLGRHKSKVRRAFSAITGRIKRFTHSSPLPSDS